MQTNYYDFMLKEKKKQTNNNKAEMAAEGWQRLKGIWKMFLTVARVINLHNTYESFFSRAR